MEALGGKFNESKKVMEFGVDQVLELVPQAVELKNKKQKNIKKYESIAENMARNYEANFGKWQGQGNFPGATLKDTALEYIKTYDPDLKNVTNTEKNFQTKVIEATDTVNNVVSTTVTTPIPTDTSSGFLKPFTSPTERDIINQTAQMERLLINAPDPNNPNNIITRPMTAAEINENLEYLANFKNESIVPQTNYRYTFAEQTKAIPLLDTAGVKRAKDSVGTDIARTFGESYDPELGGVSNFQKQNLKGIVDSAFNYANNYLSVTPEARGPEAKEIKSSHRVYARDAGILNHYNESSKFVNFGERKGRVVNSPLFAINTPQIDRIETYIVGFKNNLDNGNKNAISILNDNLVTTLTNPKTGRSYKDYAEFTKDATFNEQVNLVAKVNALNNKFNNIQPSGTSGNIQQEGKRKYTPSLMYGTNAQTAEIGAYYDPSDGNYYETVTGGTPIKNIISY